MRFKDKVVVITGAASGIGRGAALQFAKEGAKVVVSDINEEKGKVTVSDIEAAGGAATFIAANVADYEAVQTLMQGAVKTFGRIDIALNNAGLGAPPAKTADVKLKDWDFVLAINQTGVFYCMKEALKQMETQGSGCIVNIASMAGLRGLPNQIAYTASKHAVVGMTRTAALEYAKRGIRVNAVCPVFTSTPLLDLLFQAKEGMDKMLLQTIPVRRFGEVEDIVNAITWLCDEQSSFVTGMALPIDGGQSA